MKTLLTAFLLAFLLLLPTADSIADSPLRFFQNKGQWDSELLYRAEFPGGFLFLKQNSLVYVLYDAGSLNQHHPAKSTGTSRQSTPKSIPAHGVEVAFEGSSIPTITPGQPGSSKANYFAGTKDKSWTRDVSTFGEVVYKNLYPGIDFRIFAYQATIKYEFIVAPGADPSKITMDYRGANRVAINSGEQIAIETSVRTFKEAKPYSYQEVNHQAKEVTSQFQLTKSRLSFKLPEGYDRGTKLVIDPELIFSTYSGSLPDNWGHTATYDDDGNLYAGGTVFGTNFPVTIGAYQVQLAGNVDVAIMKFNPDGSELLYATYLGGSETDLPTSLIVNKKGELLVLGITSSPDFPTSVNAFQKAFAGGDSIEPLSGLELRKGADIFVSKLSSDGRQLLASTFLGGTKNDGISISSNFAVRNYGDCFRGEIVLDKDDNVIVASSTNSTDFPLKDPSQNQLGGNQDGVIFQLSPDLSVLQWSTYVGGNGYDAAFSVKVTNGGKYYVTGITKSSDLATKTGSLQGQLKGNEDAFVASYNTKKLEQITYLGTDAADGGYLLDLDPQGNVYVFGLTYGIYPISAGVYSNEKSGQFIHALDPLLTKTIFSTVIGGKQNAPDISPTAFLVNECGNIYLAGWGGNANILSGDNPKSTTRGLPITNHALKNITNGNNLYIAMLEAGAKSLLYATYFGSNSTSNPNNDPGDHVDGGTSRFDKKGVIYHSLCACSGNRFPTTPNAWSSTNNSGNCNNAAFKIDIDVLKANFDLYDGNNKNITAACMPLKLDLTNTSIGALDYTWQINGSGFSRNEDEIYTFETAGTYTITLKAFNRLTCQKEDEFSRVIVVKGFEPIVTEDTTVCHNQPATLSASGGSTYQWSPTVGISSASASTTIATVAQTTTFRVLIKDNESGCQVTKEVKVTIDDSKSDFSVSPNSTACANQSVQLVAQGSATSFLWKSDPTLTTTTGTTVTATPIQTTTYQVTGNYDDGCSPTKEVTVAVDRSYLPDFQINKSSEACNEPIYYELINKTSGAERYQWNTGIATFTDANLQQLTYETPGEYTVSLTAYNAGCSLTTSKVLTAEPSLVLANVITPNGDEKNDTFVVPVENSRLELYDRWGKQIFKSTRYQNDWGKGIAHGTYYYLIETPQGSRCKGWIQVLN
jgi:gliding motility-associated-like protein